MADQSGAWLAGGAIVISGANNFDDRTNDEQARSKNSSARRLGVPGAAKRSCGAGSAGVVPSSIYRRVTLISFFDAVSGEPERNRR